MYFISLKKNKERIWKHNTNFDELFCLPHWRKKIDSIHTGLKVWGHCFILHWTPSFTFHSSSFSFLNSIISTLTKESTGMLWEHEPVHKNPRGCDEHIMGWLWLVLVLYCGVKYAAISSKAKMFQTRSAHLALCHGYAFSRKRDKKEGCERTVGKTCGFEFSAEYSQWPPNSWMVVKISDGFSFSSPVLIGRRLHQDALSSIVQGAAVTAEFPPVHAGVGAGEAAGLRGCPSRERLVGPGNVWAGGSQRALADRLVDVLDSLEYTSAMASGSKPNTQLVSVLTQY